MRSSVNRWLENDNWPVVATHRGGQFQQVGHLVWNSQEAEFKIQSHLAIRLVCSDNIFASGLSLFG